MKRSLIVIVCIMLLLSLSGCEVKVDTTEAAGETQNVSDKNKDDAKDEVKEEAKDAADKEKTQKPLLSLKVHPLSYSENGKTLSTGKYPELTLTHDGRKQYPDLKDALNGYSEEWRNSVISAVRTYAGYAKEDHEITGEYTSEMTAEIRRFDDKMLSIGLTYYDFAGGAHPNHSVDYLNIDPGSGEKIELYGVIGREKDVPQIIMDTVYETYPDLVDEIESINVGVDGETVKDSFVSKYELDEYSWTLSKEGLEIVFSPYEIASYAAGYIEITVPYDKYPDLIKKKYIPEEESDVSKLVKEKEVECEEVEPAEPEGPVTLPNKTWKSFHDADYEYPKARYVSLKKLTEDKSDWLDTGKWASENGFRKALMPYADDDFYYEPASPVQYDYMYNELKTYDSDRKKLLYDFDLYTLINGPDEETSKTAAVTEFIRWARMYKDILYVACGHNTYASSEPDSSYIIAINPNTQNVIWRSDPLVSNALNFQIVGDTIICGYGFTAEDDYIYLLDVFTGKTVDRIRVNTGPDQFEIVGDTLYVATYNTAYTFKIIQE